jgi:hypothetical protein
MKRKGVGSIIGIAFLLLIVSTGYSYYQIRSGAENRLQIVEQEIQNKYNDANSEALNIIEVVLTPTNGLNLTVENTGPVFSTITLIGIEDKEDSSQLFFRIYEQIGPQTIINGVTNSSIIVDQDREYLIQIITEHGNQFYAEYPQESVISNSSQSSNYFDTYSSVDNHPETSIGTHSFFAAMKGYPDGLVNVLFESAVIPVPPQVDYVDNNSSDVDSGTDKGTHSNFDNQKAEDGNFDTLTEVDTGGGEAANYRLTPSSFTDINDKWGSESNAYDVNNATSATEDQQRIQNDIYFSGFNNTDQGAIEQVDIHVYMDLVGLSNDYVDFEVWVTTQAIESYTINSGNDGTGLHIIISDVTEPTDGSWSWTDIGNMEIRLNGAQVASPDSTPDYEVFEVCGVVTTSAINFELDLEVQFTSVDATSFNLTDICILTGTGDAEDLIVQLWNGTANEWNTIFDDLSATSWNNYTFKSGDIGFGTTTTIRFLGGTDTGDSTRSDWDIDALLLKHYNSVNYELDLEAQFSHLPQATNEYLSIYAGVQDLENLQVDIWNGTHYVNVMPDIIPGWNHVNVSSYHINPTFNIRFKDSIVVLDQIQDSWEIDLLVLHLWDD